MQDTILFLYFDCFRSFFLLNSAVQILLVVCILGGGLLSYLMEEMRGKTALCIGLVYVLAEEVCLFISDVERYMTSVAGIMLLGVLTGFLIYEIIHIVCKVRAKSRPS